MNLPNFDEMPYVYNKFEIINDNALLILVYSSFTNPVPQPKIATK